MENQTSQSSSFTLKTSSRTLHLIDVENLCGVPLPTREQVAQVRASYQAHIAEGDIVVVASSHLAFLTVGWAWSGVRHLLRSGPDGADLALLEVLVLERVEERFGRVIIGSGDGIFAASVAELGRSGVPVTVISRPMSLSRRLRMAAHEVVGFYPGILEVLPMVEELEAS